MAFEHLTGGYQEKYLKSMSRRMRHMIPEQFLLVGVDAARSIPGHKACAIFWDERAHQDAFNSPEQHALRLGGAGNEGDLANVPRIPEPPKWDQIRVWLDGYVSGYVSGTKR